MLSFVPTLILTRPTMVMQDIESYEQTQENMALLKILALGNSQIEEGKVKPTADVIKRLRECRECQEEGAPI